MLIFGPPVKLGLPDRSACRIDHPQPRGRAGNGRPWSKRDCSGPLALAGLRDMSISTARRTLDGTGGRDPVVVASFAWADQRRRRDLGDQGPGVRPRRRHEPVRGLRPGAPRARLSRDPRALLPAHSGRQSLGTPDPGAARLGARVRSASPRPARPAASASAATTGYRFKRSGSGVTLRSSAAAGWLGCGRGATAAGQGHDPDPGQGPVPREAPG